MIVVYVQGRSIFKSIISPPPLRLPRHPAPPFSLYAQGVTLEMGEMIVQANAAEARCVRGSAGNQHSQTSTANKLTRAHQHVCMP